MSSYNQKITSDQRNFWDSLQKDILSSSINDFMDDERYFLEKNFMFSTFFRSCLPHEIFYFQKLLQLGEHGYLIILEIKESTAALSIDDFLIYQTIKKILNRKKCCVSPLLTNRIGILITEDHLLTETQLREESTVLCNELIGGIEKKFYLNVIAGIGSMQSMQSLYSSFSSALSCLFHYHSAPIVFYLDVLNEQVNHNFDYMVTETRLFDAVRLRKSDAFDYFGLLMEWVRPLNDSMKRNKVLEILVLMNYAISQDSTTEIKPLDYMKIATDLSNHSDHTIIDYAYQMFMYITKYEKPQSTIDYSNHIVKATKEYLENHYSEDISLEDMAEYVNISPQYFSKLIKKTTGFNFIDWLSMLRVRKAKELLTNSNLTVKEVCFMVGYKDPNYFSRIFKKRIGITPSEYVKANSTS